MQDAKSRYKQQYKDAAYRHNIQPPTPIRRGHQKTKLQNKHGVSYDFEI